MNKLLQFPTLGSEHATRVRLSILQDRYFEESKRGLVGITDPVRRRYIRRMEKEMNFYSWILRDYKANTQKVLTEAAVTNLMRDLCAV